MGWFYLTSLIVSIGGLAIIDWRHKIAFWCDARRSAITIAIVVSILIIWDIIGIVLGIFFHGGSQYALAFRIAPEFPIEEIFFLVLLSYTTLMVYRGLLRWQRIS